MQDTPQQHAADDGNWRISSLKRPILDKGELLKSARIMADPYRGGRLRHPFCVAGRLPSVVQCTCGAALVLGTRMHLPEIVFGNSWLELEHAPSSCAIRFDAIGALLSWVVSSLEGEADMALQVPVAQSEYWSSGGLAGGSSRQVWDWTYGGSYRGEVFDSATGAPLTPERGTASGIDMDMLRDQTQPIVHFVEMPIYEDFLHDFGECRLVVKLRVMPRCWFLLLRYWLRVDGVVAKVRESRYFCAFGSGKVHAEHSEKEGRCTCAQPGGGECLLHRESGILDENEAGQLLGVSSPAVFEYFTLEGLEVVGPLAPSPWRGLRPLDRFRADGGETYQPGTASAGSRLREGVVAAAVSGAAIVEPAALFAASDYIECCATLHGTSICALGSLDGDLVVLDVRSEAAEPQSFVSGRHDGGVLGVSFGLAGSGADEWVLASCGEDGCVRVWSPRERAEVAVYEGMGGLGADFSSNKAGKRVASVQCVKCPPSPPAEGTPLTVAAAVGRAVYVVSGERRTKLGPLPSQVTQLEWHPTSGDLMASCCGGVSVWTAGGLGPQLWLEVKAPVLCLQVSNDGRIVATGCQDESVRMWQLSPDSVGESLVESACFTCGGYDAKVESVAFSHDSRWMASAGGNSCVVWDFGGWELADALHADHDHDSGQHCVPADGGRSDRCALLLAGRVSVLAFCAGGSSTLLAAGTDEGVLVFDLARWQGGDNEYCQRGKPTVLRPVARCATDEPVSCIGWVGGAVVGGCVSGAAFRCEV